MKVLFINPTPLFGGATTATISIALMLQHNGMEVVYSDEYDYQGKRGSLEINKYPFHRRKFKSHRETISYIVDEIRPTHIIWTPLVMPYYYFDIVKMKRMGIKQMTVIHSVSLNRNFKGKLIDFFVSCCICILDAAIFVSNYTLHSWDCGKVKSLKIIKRVIYNAVFFSGGIKRVAEPKRIGFVGRFSPEKQPDIFCSLSNVRSRHSLEFYSFGDGPLLPKYRKEYPRVTFYGNVDDIDSIYGGIDIIVMTSKFENCPMVILEAKARGIPCVAPNVGGIPEIVVNGRDGILYDNYDPSCIVHLIEHVIEKYDYFSRNCVENSVSYSYSSICGKWEMLLNDLK